MPAPITHHDLNVLVARYKTGQVGIAPPQPTVHLFTDDVTPDCHVDVTTLHEPTDPGYAPILLVPGEWIFGDFPGPGACGRQAQSGLHTYAFTVGGFTVHGMWIADPANGITMWVQRFDVPFVFPSGAGAMSVQVTDVQQQCP
jgi:hypothetical protein